MKIKKSKITSVEYSTTMTRDNLLQLVRRNFISTLAQEIGISTTEIDFDDIIVSIDENAVATISYRRDQGSRTGEVTENTKVLRG